MLRALREAPELLTLRLRFFCGVNMSEQTLLSHGLRVVPRVPDEAVEAVKDLLATTAFASALTPAERAAGRKWAGRGGQWQRHRA